jgi:DNA repair protein SbcC/Rad50
VFSVLLADEIDASMDQHRADQTAQTLRTMKERISQIILVSHKMVEADYFIQMGDYGADEPTTEDDD